MEEVAAHKQALLATSHTLLSLLHTLSIHPAFSLRRYNFLSQFYAVSCRPSLAFTFSVLNAPVSFKTVRVKSYSTL